MAVLSLRSDNLGPLARGLWRSGRTGPRHAGTGSRQAPGSQLRRPGRDPGAGCDRAKKVLRMSRQAEPFSPFIPWQIDDNPALFISVNVYDSLLRMTPDGQGVQPGLATKWEPAADGLSWTFTLRDGVKYSDGTPMKAEDVQASLDGGRQEREERLGRQLYGHQGRPGRRSEDDQDHPDRNPSPLCRP